MFCVCAVTIGVAATWATALACQNIRTIAIVAKVFLVWLATDNKNLRAAMPQHNKLDAFPQTMSY
jgi:hypothetical protein